MVTRRPDEPWLRRSNDQDEYLGTPEPFMPRRPRSDFDDTSPRLETPWGGDLGPDGPERLHDQAWGAGAEGSFEREIRARYGVRIPREDHRGVGPRAYQRPDQSIYEDICEALSDHPAVDASDVEVRVVDGEVTLRGEVTDRRHKRLVEDITEHIRGVKDVHNQLRIPGR